MTAELVQAIEFGLQGDDTNHLGAGWSAAENGFRWMVAGESDLWLDNPGPGDAFVLQVELSPYCAAPTLQSQRMTLVVRGRAIGHSVLNKGTRLAYRIPSELLAGKGPVRIVFQHPDAARPTDMGHASDSRQLALSIQHLRLLRVTGDLSELCLEGGEGITTDELEAQAGVPAAQFVLQFESLGDNCEFGLVQRRCGAEPLSLLRFANLWLADLVRAIETEFQGLGETENLEFWTDDSARNEYVVRDRKFSLIFHTFLYHGEVDETNLLLQQAARLKLLRRKLLEDLANGEKIFIVKRNDVLREEEVLPLYAALNRYGHNTLLWVVPADEQHTPGSVERVLPGLLKGYIDRFAPYENAHDLSLDCWLKLCVNARRIAPAAHVIA